MSEVKKLSDFLILLKEMDILDVLDIALVSIVFYFVINFIRNKGADKLAVGVVILVVLQLVCTKLELQSMLFLLQNVFQVGIIAIFIIFQPELRTALEKVGSEPLKNIRNMTRDSNAYIAVIEQICASVADLSSTKTGALIVIERDMKNDNLYSNGTLVDSAVTRNLLNTIFFKMTALHDGAVVIRDARVHSAACCLPLSTNENGLEAAHTRHLAALGTSERSDAVVIVVREESGKISLAIEGKFERFANAQALKARLGELIVGNIQGEKKKIINIRKNTNNDNN